MSDAEVRAGEERRGVKRNALFPVGASLYPLDNELENARDWYDRDLVGELDTLKAQGCGLVRLFVGWGVLEPQVGRYEEPVLERLVEVVAAGQSRSIKTIVCFFADDRHAELAQPSWAKQRDPRTDPYLLERASALVGTVVSRLRAEKGVFGWQLGNEAFLSGFGSAEALAEWTTALRAAILEQDPTRPIALGADTETLAQLTGVDARDAVALCDFVVAHTTAAYQAYAAPGPVTSGTPTYVESFLLHLATGASPVLLDDMGALTLEHSPEEEARLLRVSLWSGLCNRAAGALVRRLSDMETERREPYFLDPFETLVGVLDAQRRPKPALDEVRRFIRTSALIDMEKHPLIAERTAVLMPAERYDALPSLAGLHAPRVCLQAFVAAKRAHVPVSVVREGADTDDRRVLVVPGVRSLAEATWKRVAVFVQGGGTLLMSYGGGETPRAFAEIFGVEPLGDAGPRDVLSCRVAQAGLLGDLRDFDARLSVPFSALLSPTTATVVATDAAGNPLLTLNQVGQGRAVYLGVPLERAIALADPWEVPSAVTSMLREVYGAVARAAGCGSPFSCDAPDVEVALFQGDADDVLVLVNHAAEPVKANFVSERRIAAIADVRGGAEVLVDGPEFGVNLDAGGATALKLTYG